MPNLVPKVSFERISPSAFVYEIIGHSELSTIALPSATVSSSTPNQYLRLLIRLKWILQACLGSPPKGCSTHSNENGPEIPKNVLIRVITYTCDIAGSVRPNSQWSTEYTALRRTTIQLLACAARLTVKSSFTWVAEEADWIRVQLEEMVQGWSKGGALSLVEASLIKELLTPLAVAGRSVNENQPLPLASRNQTVISAAFDDLLGLSPAPYSDGKRSFWTIHDWLLTIDYEASPETQPSAVALAVYREALSKYRGRPDHHFSFPLATYVLEEFALRITSRYQLLPHEELVAENQLLGAMLKIANEEATAFCEPFPQHVSLIQFEPMVANTYPSPRSLITPTSLPASPTSPIRSLNHSPIARSPVPLRKSPPVKASTPPTHSFVQGCFPSPRQDASVPSVLSQVAEVRAYQYPISHELPSRMPTHRPQGPLPPSIEIDGGLQVVEASEFGATFDFEKMQQPSQLGLRRLSWLPEADARSLSNLSSIGSISGRSKRSLFSKLGGARRPSLSPLPSSLEFCFSTNATQILFWCKKSPDAVIRTQYPYQETERFEMFVPDSLTSHPSKPPTHSIRLFAAAPNTAVAVVHFGESRWLYSLHETSFQPLVLIPDTAPPILSIAISNNGTYVALGCGQSVLVYRILLQRRLSGPWKLDPNTDLGSRMARLNKLSFSPDSRRLISAVQVEHSTHKHAVFISAWSCSDDKFRLEAQLDPVYLTVGYSDDTGISAVFLTGQSDSLAVQQAFLTAALSKSYPSILPIASGLRNQHLDIADKRIDGAAQCPSPMSPYLCVLRSGRNKVFVVDTRSGVSEKIADFSAERKGLHLRHEHVALGMQGPDMLYALWRSADENLILKSMSRGKDGKWMVQGMELGMLYRQATGLS